MALQPCTGEQLRAGFAQLPSSSSSALLLGRVYAEQADQMSKRKRAQVEQALSGDPVHDNKFLKRLDTDSLAYFHEVHSHWQSLEDLDERTIVADNALQEALAKPLQVGSDAECSRIVEALLSSASEEGLVSFADGLLEGSTWITLSTKYDRARFRAGQVKV